ncbi:MAG: TIGR03086 family metal-binding protein [Pseudonocardiaceae bacterium]
MTTILDFDPPARQLTRLVNGVTDDQLVARTPCEAYTVGDLLDHLMGLTIAFRNAATKSTGSEDGEPAQVSRPGEASAAHLRPDWRSRLPVQLSELVAAWKDPAAWEGTTEAGGVTLPADVMGRVAINELVLHGWDLARGTGQPFACDPTIAQACFEFTSMMSAPGEEAGREGLFGPVVEVSPDAPLFDRVLGLSGRHPSWTP